MAEAIEGVVLNDLVAGVETEIIHGKRDAARRVIHGIYRDLELWAFEVRKRNNEIKALEGKIQGALTKLEKIKAGDWSAMPDWSAGTAPNAPKAAGQSDSSQ